MEGPVRAAATYDPVMMSVGLVILASVVLGGGFGEASAEITTISEESMTVVIDVEVQSSATSVVAHLLAPGEPELVLPLLVEPDGRFGVSTELRPIDYHVIFEAIGELGIASQPVSLSQLGARFPSGPGTTTAAEADGFSPDVRRRGWLALALAAGSLSLLAFWALGEGAQSSSGADEEKGDSPAGDPR